MYYQQWLQLDDYCVCMQQIERVKPRIITAHARELINKIYELSKGDVYNRCGYYIEQLYKLSEAQLHNILVFRFGFLWS